MRCRIVSESYQEESRLKTSCLKLDPTDYVAEGRSLLQRIAALR
jgi:hypothetical protein